MQIHQLKINRSVPRSFRWPAWINVLAIGCAIGLVLATSVWTVHQSESTLQSNVASKLQTILKIESEAVRKWVNSEIQLARFLASDAELAQQMLVVETDPTALGQLLDDISSKLGNKACLLITTAGRRVASSGDDWLNARISSLQEQFCETLVEGQPTTSSVLVPLSDSPGANPYALVVAAPIQHPDEGIVGFLGIGHDAAQELSTVLESSRAGETGETLAVTATGELISQSRFLAPSGSKILSFVPERRAFRPSNVVIDLDGSPDHRGVYVVSASQWMPGIGIGLVTKMDLAEAIAPVIQVRRFIWTLCGLLLLTTITTIVYRWYLFRLKRHARQADLERKRLGPYELEEKIGEGGMGVVYRARHALMRRPTAIKILPPDKSNQISIERFEHEVQSTNQLKHPNTISIYDYGRSANGLFYYAMELLDGLNLEQLVQREGTLPDGRVINVLRQICDSLREAHSLGLVHRDIKPANIMLCNRGGAFDTVKVLDFGMVRARASKPVEWEGAFSGTPSYMAPDCFTDPASIDPRIDVFAVGAVGFFLLTGEPLLNARNLHELANLHRTDLQALCRQRLQSAAAESGHPVSSQLIELISHCVATERSRRIGSVALIMAELSDCRPVRPWTHQQAAAWWRSTSLDSSPQAMPDSDTGPVPSLSLNTTQAYVAPRLGPARMANHRLVECQSA